ncbi:MAG: nucleotidyl transferase AbiEii/AbiGii toxin family protein [Nitrosomonadales bacterium]|nr:nucleotidyl transferase AbiEii/AbiGii toxin family protein [Nitrosomonadales bacterium]
MNMFDLLKMLTEAKVEFVLVGGLAVALHGYQRVTMDVDVVLAMDEGNLRRFLSMAKASGLRPTIPVEIESLAKPELIEQWYREKGMLAFSLRGAEAMATVIDVLVKPVIAFADLRREATMVEVGTISIPVASIEHLITMKTGTGRSKDLIDIEELQKIQALK